MYEKEFSLERMPFVRNVPSEQLYESPAMKEALSRLQYAASNQLFAVVTADAGCGKSTLLRKFNDSLPKDKYMVMYVSDSKLTPKWLYINLLDQLGLEASFYRGHAKKQLQKQIGNILEKEHRKVVCILDEEKKKKKETLEEFRFLLNSEFDSVSNMSLILAGQTELWDTKLRFRKYAAIRQRIDINCILPHLDRPETEQYIESHLRYAGCNQTLFTEKALDEIYRSSSGIPRLINRTCDKCLTYAAQQHQKLVDDHIVRFIIDHEMLGAAE